MCKAMNRSFFSVILGGFGAAEGRGGGRRSRRQCAVGSADDAAFLMANAESVIIVPGYGLAVARAQHAVKEMAHEADREGRERALRHPSGRGPHAWAHERAAGRGRGAPTTRCSRWRTSTATSAPPTWRLILGANDVVNPAAKTPGSPIYGMPILGGVQGADRDREQAVDGCGLCGPGQRAVLHG